MSKYKLVTINANSGWNSVEELVVVGWLTIIPIRTHLTGCGSSYEIVGQVENGSVFVVGDGYDSQISDEGELRLAVNGGCSGTVTVLILVDAPSQPEHQGSIEQPFNFATADSEESSGRISLHSGEKRHSETDLILGTPTGPLTFTRSYRQGALEEYQFMGRGWTHNHNVVLAGGPGPIAINLPHGGTSYYYEDIDTGFYIPGFGALGKATFFFGSSTTPWIVTFPDLSSWVFERSVNQDVWNGRLKERRWPGGEAWFYTYYDTDNLRKVADGHGHELNFEYWTEGPYLGQLRSVTDHTGRSVHLNYTTSGEGNLLSEVVDVFGQNWQYEYDSGETEPALQDFLIKRISPSVDTTGDGTPDTPLTLERLTFQLSGETINDLPLSITQEMGIVGEGDALLKAKLVFGADEKNLTTETVANRMSKHYFANGIYAGSRDATNNIAVQVGDNDHPLDFPYCPSALVDANANLQQLFWIGRPRDLGINLLRSINALGGVTQFAYDPEFRLFMRVDANKRLKVYLYENVSQPRWPTIILTGSSNPIEDGMMELQDDDPENPWIPIVGNEPDYSRQDFEDSESQFYFRTIVTSAIGQGIESNEFEVVEGLSYLVLAWIRAQDCDATVAITGTPGAEVSITAAEEIWQMIKLSYVPTESGTVKLQFSSASSSSGSFDVSFVAVVNLTNVQREEIAYDDSGRVLSHMIVDPVDATTVLRKVTNTYYEDGLSAGLLATTSIHDRNDDDVTLTRSFEYNNYGLVAKITDETGMVKLIGYDAASRVMREVESASDAIYDFLAHPELDTYSITSDPDKDLVTHYIYDPVGRLIETRTAVGTSLFRRDLTAYDAMGRIIRTIENYVQSLSLPSPYTSPRTAFDHGANNDQNLITDISYNERGLVSKKVDQAGVVTLFGYDDADRLVKKVYSARFADYDASYLSGDPDLSEYTGGENSDQDIITTYEYDNAGNLVKSVDPLGNVSFTAYDALNRPIKSVQSANSAATVTYEPGDPSYVAANDPRSDSYTPLSSADKDIITTRTYDAVGNVVKTVDPLGNMAFVVYDGLDRVIKTVRNAHDGASLLATDANGYDEGNDPRSDSYSVSNESDRDIITRTIYEDALRVEHTEDPMGVQTWLAYDGFNRVIQSILNPPAPSTNDPRSESYSPSNDADTDIITKTEYNELGQLQNIIDPIGRKTVYEYDAIGRVVGTIVNAVDDGNDSDQNVTTKVYFDKLGRVSAQMDPLGNTTIHEYDGLGRRNRTNVNASAGRSRAKYPDLDRITRFSYGLDSQPISVFDPAGVETRFEYDLARRRVQTVANYKDGIFDPNHTDTDIITHTAYNKAGLVTSVTDPRGGLASMDYDGALRPRAVTRPNGAVDWTCYDKAGQVACVIQNVGYRPGDEVTPDDPSYDPQGHGNNDRDLISATVRDRAGRVINAVDPLGNATQMTYSKAGSLLSSIDPAWVETRYTYDDIHRLIRVVKAYQESGGHGSRNDRNITTEITLDKAGRQTALTDPNNNTTSYGYDGIDRQKTVADPLDHVWHTDYSHLSGGSGFRVTATDPNGHQVKRDMDRLGRPTSVVYGDANTPDVSFKYNLSGDLIQMMEKVAGTKVRRADYRYDDMHRLNLVNLDSDGNGTVDQGISYQYEAGGLRTQISSLTGPTINYRYDDSGRLKRIHGGDWDTSFDYDGVDRMISVSRDNGPKSTYHYDAAGRLAKVVHKGDEVFGSFGYVRDEVGNPKEIHEYVPVVGNVESTLEAADATPKGGDWQLVDGFQVATKPGSLLLLGAIHSRNIVLTLGRGPDHGICEVIIDDGSGQRRVKAVNTHAAAVGEKQYAINLKAEGPMSLFIRSRAFLSHTKVRYKSTSFPSASDNQVVTYSYDAMNRPYHVDIATPFIDPENASEVIYDFEYDRAGHLRRHKTVYATGIGGVVDTTLDYDEHDFRLISNGGASVQYDANGNVLSDGATTYTWDRANRLINVQHGDQVFTHKYNGLNQRVEMGENDGTTRFLYDGISQFAIGAINNAGTTRFLIGPLGIHAQQTNTDAWIYPVMDGLGNIRGVVENGGQTESRQYSPIGQFEQALASGMRHTPYGLNGGQDDPSGLNYLFTNYYHPGMGIEVANILGQFPALRWGWELTWNEGLRKKWNISLLDASLTLTYGIGNLLTLGSFDAIWQGGRTVAGTGNPFLFAGGVGSLILFGFGALKLGHLLHSALVADAVESRALTAPEALAQLRDAQYTAIADRSAGLGTNVAFTAGGIYEAKRKNQPGAIPFLLALGLVGFSGDLLKLGDEVFEQRLIAEEQLASRMKNVGLPEAALLDWEREFGIQPIVKDLEQYDDIGYRLLARAQPRIGGVDPEFLVPTLNIPDSELQASLRITREFIEQQGLEPKASNWVKLMLNEGFTRKDIARLVGEGTEFTQPIEGKFSGLSLHYGAGGMPATSMIGFAMHYSAGTPERVVYTMLAPLNLIEEVGITVQGNLNIMERESALLGMDEIARYVNPLERRQGYPLSLRFNSALSRFVPHRYRPGIDEFLLHLENM